MSHDYRRISTNKVVDRIDRFVDVYSHIEEFLTGVWQLETENRRLFQFGAVIRYVGNAITSGGYLPKTQFFKIRLETISLDGMLLEIGHILDGIKTALDYQPFHTDNHTTIGMHGALLYYDEDSILLTDARPGNVKVIEPFDDTQFTQGGG